MVNVRDTFDLIAEARKATRRELLNNGKSYGGPGSKADPKQTIFTCKSQGCKFRIRITASKKGIQVTKSDPHTCLLATYYKFKPSHSMWYLKDYYQASVSNNCDITPAQIQSDKRI
jgi:hypothetical protein